jgi:hypothetical protein
MGCFIFLDMVETITFHCTNKNSLKIFQGRVIVAAGRRREKEQKVGILVCYIYRVSVRSPFKAVVESVLNTHKQDFAPKRFHPRLTAQRMQKFGRTELSAPILNKSKPV